MAVLTLRERMPVTAWLIDELRKQWSVEATDALVRRAMRGEAGLDGGALYMAELDGNEQLVEFGSTADGRHVVQAEQGGLVWVSATGRPLAPPPTPLTGPSGKHGARVIRASIAANANGGSKGVVR